MQGDMTFSILGGVAALLLGGGGIVRGLQLRRGRIELVSDWDSQPLPDPERLAPLFARVYLRAGFIILLLPLALWLGLPLIVYGMLFAIVTWYWLEAIDRIAERARRGAVKDQP